MHPQRLLFALVCLALMAGIFLVLREPAHIGFIIGQGGNVTQLNLGRTSDSWYWHGVYGSFGTGRNSISLQSNQSVVSYMQVSLPACYDTEIYATSAGNINWPLLEPALPSDVDAFLNISHRSMFSGTGIFQASEAFSVANRGLMLYSTRINSQAGDYIVGLLKDSSGLVFVTRPVRDGRAFDGLPADYQMMLPVPLDRDLTYSFFIDPYDAAGCNITLPVNSPPALSHIGTITGYVGRPIHREFYATDADGDALGFFTRPHLAFLNLQVRLEPDRHVATINFTPAEGGAWHTNFLVSDGLASDSERVQFQIGWCGDADATGKPLCDSRYESCESCPRDCGPCRDSGTGIVIIADEPACTGTLNLTTYTRHDERCPHPGRYLQGAHVCEPLPGVQLQLFYENKGEWLHLMDGATGMGAEFAAELGPNEYKVSASKTGYYPGFLFFSAYDCPEEMPEAKAPMPEPMPEETTEPQIDQPLAERFDIPGYMLLVYNLILAGLAGFLIWRIHSKTCR